MKKIYLLLFIVIASFNACTVALDASSIPPEMKSVTINYFENNAPLVVPYLSQQFTEALKSRIRNQTRLSVIQNDGDAIFEGRITGYDVKPVTLTDNTQATSNGTNRLSITVAVKFTNNINPKLSYEQSFTRSKDFPLSGASFQSLEPGLVRDINVMLAEDIFNRAFAQWN